jgi:gamma-glutamyltranspeptidase/glutathione hydrolase
VNVLGHERELADAVGAPRLHWDGGTVQVEPGYPGPAVDALAQRWPVNEWPARNLFFGGVHAVRPGPSGAAAGDPRRGGARRVVGE